VAFGAAALLLPEQLLQLALGSAETGVLDPVFLRVAGATMVLSVAVE
jgi:hypothetical protein